MKLAITDTALTMSDGDPRECDVPWSDSRWAALDGAISIFLTEMNATLADEQVSIVTYSSDYTACGVTSVSATLDQPLTENTASITSAMANLSSSIWGGMTETSEGPNHVGKLICHVAIFLRKVDRF